MLPNHACSGGEHFVPFFSSTGSGRGRSTPFWRTATPTPA